MAAREAFNRYRTPKVTLEDTVLGAVDDRRFAIRDSHERRLVAEYVMRELPDDEWVKLRNVINDCFTHSSKTDQLMVTELHLRRDQPEHTIDEDYPVLSRGRAAGLFNELMKRVVDDDVLMRRITYSYEELTRVKKVPASKLRWLLHRMPQRYRDHIIDGFVPPNSTIAYSGRDRDLAHDVYDSDLSDKQLAEKYGSTPGAWSVYKVDMMERLTQRPLVMKLAAAYLAQLKKVKPMTEAEVSERLAALGREQVAEVIESIPVDAWSAKKANVQRDKSFVSMYLSASRDSMDSFVEQFNAVHPDTQVTTSNAHQILSATLKKISKEPTVIDRIRVLSGEASAMHDLKPASMKPRGVDLLMTEPPVRETASGHAKAVLGRTVGDIKAFCSKTLLPEAFLYSLDLDGLNEAFSSNGVKPQSALASVAGVLYIQSVHGGLHLTPNGLSAALSVFRENGNPVDEIVLSTGTAMRLEVGGDNEPTKLCLNRSKADKIDDDSLVAYARKSAPKDSGAPAAPASEEVVEPPARLELNPPVSATSDAPAPAAPVPGPTLSAEQLKRFKRDRIIDQTAVRLRRSMPPGTKIPQLKEALTALEDEGIQIPESLLNVLMPLRLDYDLPWSQIYGAYKAEQNRAHTFRGHMEMSNVTAALDELSGRAKPQPKSKPPVSEVKPEPPAPEVKPKPPVIAAPKLAHPEPVVLPAGFDFNILEREALMGFMTLTRDNLLTVAKQSSPKKVKRPQIEDVVDALDTILPEFEGEASKAGFNLIRGIAAVIALRDTRADIQGLMNGLSGALGDLMDVDSLTRAHVAQVAVATVIATDVLEPLRQMNPHKYDPVLAGFADDVLTGNELLFKPEGQEIPFASDYRSIESELKKLVKLINPIRDELNA